MRVYQNVFTLRGKTYIREFDTESKETFFKEETVIPEIFIEDKDGNIISKEFAYNMPYVGNLSLICEKRVTNISYPTC